MSRATTGGPLFGFSPWRLGVAEAGELLRLARRADDTGLDLFSVSDHPYVGAKLDAYASVATILGVTARLSAVVSVTCLPLRPAPLLARTVTSLAALSGGRTILGLGAGGSPEGIGRLGVTAPPPDQAVRALAEAVELVHGLSGGGSPWSFDGRVYQVHDVEPAPVEAPPIWTGSVGPRSLEVTGRLADGWIPGHAADWHSARYRDSRAVIDRAARDAGREPERIATVFNVLGRITDEPVRENRDGDGRWSVGSVGQWVDELTRAVDECGASGFVFHLADPSSLDLALGRWSEEIAPAVRRATAGAR